MCLIYGRSEKCNTQEIGTILKELNDHRDTSWTCIFQKDANRNLKEYRLKVQIAFEPFKECKGFGQILSQHDIGLCFHRNVKKSILKE